jgi:hypothetical protein
MRASASQREVRAEVHASLSDQASVNALKLSVPGVPGWGVEERAIQKREHWRKDQERQQQSQHPGRNTPGRATASVPALPRTRSAVRLPLSSHGHRLIARPAAFCAALLEPAYWPKISLPMVFANSFVTLVSASVST